MNTKLLGVLDLVRDLVESYIRNPHDLQLDSKEVPGALYLRITAHGDDTPAIVGKQGTHIRALQLLAEKFGAAAGTPCRLSLAEPKIAGERRRLDAPVVRGVFDCEPSVRLLYRIVAALGVAAPEVSASVSALNPPEVNLKVVVRTPGDYGRLVGYVNAPTLTTSAEETVVGAIGTLFRAAANAQGVTFRIAVVAGTFAQS